MTKMTKQPSLSLKHIVITGANSGLGRGLALAYAKGGAHLYLIARNEQRLAQVVTDCQQAGAANVLSQAIDVRDAEALQTCLSAWDDAHPIDCVIANAGIGNNRQTDAAKDKEVFDINLYGVLNSIHPLMPRFRERRHGQLVLMSSLASYVGLKDIAAYSGSKAAVRVYGEALRATLAPDNVGVSVICPGFVETPLTTGKKLPRWLFYPMDKSVAVMQKGIAKNRGVIRFPWRLRLIVFMMRGWIRATQ
jgi:short-subunit dehydrogenase